MALELVFKEGVDWVVIATEVISMLIIAVGVVRGAVATLRLALGSWGTDTTRRDPRESIRLQLGRSLALALEFQLAADILKTAVTPTWDEIGKVAAIIVLRTMLNFFLEREIASAEVRQS